MYVDGAHRSGGFAGSAGVAGVAGVACVACGVHAACSC